MKKLFLLGFIVLILLFLLACTAGPNTVAGSENREGEVAGFLQGLWHGIIAPVTFVISLFNENTNIYEVHNNGRWYNFGFILGVMIIFGGGGNGAGRKSRRNL
ncbi:MAG: hypothetical protein DRP87_18295 [Spirochaetes bacterium]|nr:MAG: hypothetical protein DRP87_18295 [Spirochaetota bacterium]